MLQPKERDTLPRIAVLRATYLRDRKYKYDVCLSEKENKVFASNRVRARIGVVGRHGQSTLGEGINFGELDRENLPDRLTYLRYFRASGKARVNIRASPRPLLAATVNTSQQPEPLQSLL